MRTYTATNTCQWWTNMKTMKKRVKQWMRMIKSKHNPFARCQSKQICFSSLRWSLPSRAQSFVSCLSRISSTTMVVSTKRLTPLWYSFKCLLLTCSMFRLWTEPSFPIREPSSLTDTQRDSMPNTFEQLVLFAISSFFWISFANSWI